MVLTCSTGLEQRRAQLEDSPRNFASPRGIRLRSEPVKVRQTHVTAVSITLSAEIDVLTSHTVSYPNPDCARAREASAVVRSRGLW